MFVGTSFHMSMKTPAMSSMPQKKWYVHLKPFSGSPPRPKNHGCHGVSAVMHGVAFASHWSDTGTVVSGVACATTMSTPSVLMSSPVTSPARLGSDCESLSRISTL